MADKETMKNAIVADLTRIVIWKNMHKNSTDQSEKILLQAINLKSILHRSITGVLDSKNDYEGPAFLELKKLMSYLFAEKPGTGEKKEKDAETDALLHIAQYLRGSEWKKLTVDPANDNILPSQVKENPKKQPAKRKRSTSRPANEKPSAPENKQQEKGDIPDEDKQEQPVKKIRKNSTSAVDGKRKSQAERLAHIKELIEEGDNSKAIAQSHVYLGIKPDELKKLFLVKANTCSICHKPSKKLLNKGCCLFSVNICKKCIGDYMENLHSYMVAKKMGIKPIHCWACSTVQKYEDFIEDDNMFYKRFWYFLLVNGKIALPQTNKDKLRPVVDWLLACDKIDEEDKDKIRLYLPKSAAARKKARSTSTVIEKNVESETKQEETETITPKPAEDETPPMKEEVIEMKPPTPPEPVIKEEEEKVSEEPEISPIKEIEDKVEPMVEDTPEEDKVAESMADFEPIDFSTMLDEDEKPQVNYYGSPIGHVSDDDDEIKEVAGGNAVQEADTESMDDFMDYFN